jgi:V8-like Glu-specific endopeptidase
VGEPPARGRELVALTWRDFGRRADVGRSGLAEAGHSVKTRAPAPARALLRSAAVELKPASLRGQEDAMRSWMLCALWCWVAGCGQPAEPPSVVMESNDPIVGGSLDDGDPSVVALYAQQLGAQTGYLCTASVISPTVLLTAAHCVSPTETGADARFVVLTSANVNRRGGGQQLAVREVHANPLWSADHLEAGHDQGIVILAQPTTLKPLPFNRDPLPAADVGSKLRIVGYGLDDGSLQTGAGVKRQALTSLRAISAKLLRVGDSRHGTCNGDSGGPAFMDVDGVETIVGTTSYGNATCTDGGYDARVDVDLDFIDQYLVPSCAPVCAGRACGGDGCGGSCGTCTGAGELCDADGQCVPPSAGCGAGGREQEPNDSALQANVVCATGESTGSLSSATDQDWFSWTVAANVDYDARLAAGGSGAVLRVYKLSATGRLSFIGDGPDVARHTTTGGAYVARVTGPAKSSGSYTLTVGSTP